MAPILSPNFKFKLFFMGPSSNILIPSPIPTLNVFRYAWMLGSSSPFFNWVKLGSANAIKPLLKEPRKSYDKYRVFQDTWVARFPWALGLASQNFVEQTLLHQNSKWSLLFVPQLKKRISFFHLSWILSKSTLVTTRQLLPH